MKVLLLNPLLRRRRAFGGEEYVVRSGSRWPHAGFKPRGAAPRYLPFPFSLAFAAAVLRREGFEADALDAVALDVPRPELLFRAAAARPDVIFFEPAAPSHAEDLALGAELRARTGARIVMGGPHASYLAEEMVSGAPPAADFVLCGEYDETLAALCRVLSSGGHFPPGTVCFRNGKTERAGGRGLVADLDFLPDPAFDLFPSPSVSDPTRYWDGFCQSRPAVQLQSSRGCRHACYFCLYRSQVYASAPAPRFFSAARVAEGFLNAVRKFGAREVYFDDDDFASDRARTGEICRALEAVRPAGAGWSCMASAAGLDEDLLERMARSGCVGIKIGVESAAPEALRHLGKPVDLAYVERLFVRCRALGVKTHATFMLGLLGETPAGARATASFAARLGCDTLQLSLAVAYPGTPMHARLQEKGFAPDGDLRKYAQDPGGLEKLRQKALARAALGRILRFWAHRRVIARTLAGLGPVFVIRQAAWIVFEEVWRRSGAGDRRYT